MRRAVVFLSSALVLSAVAKPSAGAQPAGEKKPANLIRIDTMTSLSSMIREATADFARQHRAVIQVIPHIENAKGLGCVESNACDFSFAIVTGSLDEWLHGFTLPKESDIEKYDLIPFAVDALGIWVNDSAKVENLSKEQIREIFEGRIKNWKEVGGADLPIAVVTRKSVNPKESTFLKFFEIDNDKIVGPLVSTPTAAFNHMRYTKGSITFAGLALTDSPTVDKKGGHPVAINGQAMTKENIQSGKYYAIRKIYLLRAKSLKSSNQQASELIDFLLKNRGESLNKAGLLPLE